MGDGEGEDWGMTVMRLYIIGKRARTVMRLYFIGKRARARRGQGLTVMKL